MELKNRTVLITGAAGGIGRAMAEEFARAGAKLVLTDTKDSIKKLSAKFADARKLEMNVLDSASIEKTRKLLAKEKIQIDVLINNAGTVFGGPFLSVPLERHRFTYELNAIAPVLVTHAFLPDMKDRETSFVFVASASGFIGLPHGATYASSKWALIGFAESLRNELSLEHSPAAVTIVCPSYVDTGLFEGARGPWLTRILKPEEVGRAVVRAVQSRRVYVKLPWSVYLINAARVVLPISVFDWFMRATGTTASMTGWKGHGQGR